jgi:hypothetical protein
VSLVEGKRSEKEEERRENHPFLATGVDGRDWDRAGERRRDRDRRRRRRRGRGVIMVGSQKTAVPARRRDSRGGRRLKLGERHAFG